MNPVVAGNFLHTLGGNDWDPSDLTGEMSDPDLDGIFEFEATVPEGDWEFKVTLNHNWDQNTNPTNIGFHSDGVYPTVITYDMSNNETTVTGVVGLLQDVLVTFSVDMSCIDPIDPDGVFLAGTFTDWGNGELPMAPLGGGIYALDVLFEEGDAYHHEYKFKNGHGGWESIPNRSLDIDDTEPFMILPTVMFDDWDCPTEVVLPATLTLAANYPNPFNPTTNIQFALPAPGDATLTVYNMLGNPIATLVDGNLPAGTHTVQFNASDLPSGVYYYSLASNGETRTNIMLLIK